MAGDRYVPWYPRYKPGSRDRETPRWLLPMGGVSPGASGDRSALGTPLQTSCDTAGRIGTMRGRSKIINERSQAYRNNFCFGSKSWQYADMRVT